jgi:hypothetical protein
MGDPYPQDEIKNATTKNWGWGGTPSALDTHHQSVAFIDLFFFFFLFLFFFFPQEANKSMETHEVKEALARLAAATRELALAVAATRTKNKEKKTTARAGDSGGSCSSPLSPLDVAVLRGCVDTINAIDEAGEPSDSSASLMALPPEVVLGSIAIPHLDHPSAACLAASCRWLHDVVMACGQLWRALYMRRLGRSTSPPPPSEPEAEAEAWLVERHALATDPPALWRWLAMARFCRMEDDRCCGVGRRSSHESDALTSVMGDWRSGSPNGWTLKSVEGDHASAGIRRGGSLRGVGARFWAGGKRQVATFEDNRAHGWVSMRYGADCGVEYEGGTTRDYFDGFGVMRWGAARYMGEWREGEMTGWGMLDARDADGGGVLHADCRKNHAHIEPGMVAVGGRSLSAAEGCSATMGRRGLHFGEMRGGMRHGWGITIEAARPDRMRLDNWSRGQRDRDANDRRARAVSATWSSDGSVFVGSQRDERSLMLTRYPNGDVLLGWWSVRCEERPRMLEVVAFVCSYACPDAEFAGLPIVDCAWDVMDDGAGTKRGPLFVPTTARPPPHIAGKAVFGAWADGGWRAVLPEGVTGGREGSLLEAEMRMARGRAEAASAAFRRYVVAGRIGWGWSMADLQAVAVL